MAKGYFQARGEQVWAARLERQGATAADAARAAERIVVQGPDQIAARAAERFGSALFLSTSRAAARRRLGGGVLPV